MKKPFLLKFIIAATLLGSTLGGASAQTAPENDRKVNSPFFPNPKIKAKTEKSAEDNPVEIIKNTETVQTEVLPALENEVAESAAEKEIMPLNSPILPVENKEFESRSIASKTLEVVKRAGINAISPAEVYKIGIGDVLFISLRDAPPKASNYFTVLNDGTIDYPLANEMVAVSGLTVEEIEDALKEKIKLYENPQISVKVREHASHAVTVLGMVEKSGEIYLKREAMPLFTIRAEVAVLPNANFLIIKRADSKTEQIDLRDAKSDDTLIFPGDILEFKFTEINRSPALNSQFYFIGGNVASGGQKDFYPGLSLTQAILASGGLKKSSVKKVVIRRKNQDGLLSPFEFNLNSIKNGKQPDPQIQAGDTIEITN